MKRISFENKDSSNNIIVAEQIYEYPKHIFFIWLTISYSMQFSL